MGREDGVLAPISTKRSFYFEKQAAVRAAQEKKLDKKREQIKIHVDKVSGIIRIECVIAENEAQKNK